MTRKNFTAKTKKEVLEEQDGLCANCGSFLVKGYHAHHIDGDNTNVAKENCELLCSTCHGAKKGESDLKKQLREAQEKAIEGYDMILEKASEGKFSGSHIDKLRDVIHDRLQVAWRLFGEPDYPEPMPADMLADIEAEQQRLRFEGHIEGFKAGLEAGVALYRGVKDSD